MAAGRTFQSCLLVADRGTDTAGLTQAMYAAGFAVLQRRADPTTIRLACSTDFDLVLWHWDRDHTPALAQICGAGIPVIAILDEATTDAVSDSLLAGADACLQLDAEPRVVTAQVQAVLRKRVRPGNAKPAPKRSRILQIGDLRVDVDRCEVERAGEPVSLTPHEFRILEYMARNAGRVLKPHEILNAVTSDYEYLPREAQDVLKVAVRRIRRKIEPDEAEPQYLVTVRGFGYRLEGGNRRGTTRRTAASRTA
ncbi:MAG: hypothetical protein Kow0010_12630 [Dehalococcoidia bacterium]